MDAVIIRNGPVPNTSVCNKACQVDPQDFRTAESSSRDHGPSQDTAVTYHLDDSPPMHVAVISALQLVMANVPFTLLTVYIIRGQICAQYDNILLAELMSGTLIITGISVLLMVTCAIRLPILMGTSLAAVVPVVAMMDTKQWACPQCDHVNQSVRTGGLFNNTSVVAGCGEDAWRPRLLEITGGLLAASLVHTLIGCTGIMGSLQRYIGPVTVGPTMSLIGLTLFKLLVAPSATHWGITAITVISFVIFALVLEPYSIPIPYWTPSRGCSVSYLHVFRLFSLLLAMLIGWLVAAIFTASGLLSSDPNDVTYSARVDIRNEVISESRWFFFPYPGYRGTPTFSVGVVVGMIAAFLEICVETIGNFYATATVCQVPIPPSHAVNRGIVVEGLVNILSALMGTCAASTPYAENIAILAVTGMHSRWPYIIAGIIFVVSGLFGKFGAALSTCPDPVIGALGIVGLGLIASVGISMLRHCDMSAMRNMVIVALALALGTMMPLFIDENPGVIQTGSESLDEVLIIVLDTGMLIGGLVAFVLDNTVPGSDEERGISLWTKDLEVSDTRRGHPTYDLPHISDWLRRQRWTPYVPFLPGYTGRGVLHYLKKFCKKATSSQPDVTSPLTDHTNVSYQALD